MARHGLALSEEETRHLNLAWHRLDPWPDSVAGLTRLKRRFTIATLSNGNVALLVNMAKHGGLPWDMVFSAELVRHSQARSRNLRYGPGQLLGLEPTEVMMVAAHPGDLEAARRRGLRTAYVVRPQEHGAGRPAAPVARDAFDVVVDDFEALAQAMGA